MTKKQFDELKEGDIVWNHRSGSAYTIVHVDPTKKIAIRSITLTHPEEWFLSFKANYQAPKI